MQTITSIVDDLEGWVIAGLAAAVATLWKRTTFDHNRILSRLDECEDDRAELWDKIRKMEKSVEDSH